MYLAVASLASLGARRLWPKVDTGSGAASHASLAGLLNRQLLCNGGKEVLDILRGLRRGFEEEEASLIGVCLGIFGGDGALVGLFGNKIELVTGEGDDDVLVCLSLKLLNPCLCFIEGGLE